MKKLLPRIFAYIVLATATVGTAQIIGQALSGGPEHAPKYPPGVPAAVENLRVETDGTAVTGEILFNMPSTTFDGTAQSSDERCSYTIEVNGTKVKDNVQFWWCDEASHALHAEGHGQEFTVTVWATNDLGDGPKTTITKYIGEDQAAPVSDFVMTVGETAFELSWKPTAASTAAHTIRAASSIRSMHIPAAAR